MESVTVAAAETAAEAQDAMIVCDVSGSNCNYTVVVHIVNRFTSFKLITLIQLCCIIHIKLMA